MADALTEIREWWAEWDFDYTAETNAPLRELEEIVRPLLARLSELEGAQSRIARLEAALVTIAYEPLGPSDATHQQALDIAAAIASEALKPAPAAQPPATSGQEFRQYQRKQIAELRPWQSGDDMTHISVSEPDRAAGSPKPGDMIARNPKNHADQWLVAATYFADNFESKPAPAQQPEGQR